MQRTLGAALLLALATTAASAATVHPRSPVIKIGATKLPAAAAHSPHRFGATIPSVSCNPNFVTGQIPPAWMFNQAWACALPLAGGTMTGPLGLPASSTFTASFSLPPGQTPISPSNGDIWATNSGLFTQVAGSTIGPLGTGGGGSSASPFLPTPAYATLSVGASSTRVALPANNGSIIVYNTGANAASVTLGDGTAVATGANDVIPAGSWTSFSVNTFVDLAGIEATGAAGTTTLVISGGSGLPTGTGGGSSGSGSNASVGSTGTAVPSSATYMGMLVAGNLTGIPGTASGIGVQQATASNLNATVVGTGTFSTQLTGATNNINNIAGTVSLPTGASTSALQTTGNTALTTINTTLGAPMQNSGGSVTANAGTNLNTSLLALESGGNLASIKADTDNLNLTQGSATSGQKGNLNLGAVTSAAPTYSNTQSSPLSLTTAGALRTDSSATTQPVTTATNVTPNDCSGTITAGGTAQVALAAQTTLHGLTIANIDSTTGSGEALWISFTTSAAASGTGSFALPPPAVTTFAGEGSYTSPPSFGTNHAVSVIAATTGHKFSCTWW